LLATLIAENVAHPKMEKAKAMLRQLACDPVIGIARIAATMFSPNTWLVASATHPDLQERWVPTDQTKT